MSTKVEQIETEHACTIMYTGSKATESSFKICRLSIYYSRVLTAQGLERAGFICLLHKEKGALAEGLFDTKSYLNGAYKTTDH